jgi:hypothetical protein
VHTRQVRVYPVGVNAIEDVGVEVYEAGCYYFTRHLDDPGGLLCRNVERDAGDLSILHRDVVGAIEILRRIYYSPVLK